MNLIKIISLVLMLFLCSSVVTAGLRNSKSSKKISYAYNKADLSKMSEKDKKKINITKKYIKAKSLYFANDIDMAEQYADSILSIEDNEKAYDLKNKILLLNERISFLKKDIINDYLVELKRTVKEANYYEGFMYIKKIQDISPEEDVSYSKSRLEAEKKHTEDFFDNDSDRVLFQKSLKYFLEEKYSKARDIIEFLSQKYSRFATYKNIIDTYMIDEQNQKRINYYYNQALNSVNKSRFPEARDYIELAYGLNSKDIRVLTLMEQISLEMM